MNKFVTLFPYYKDFHFYKDVGQIPLAFQEHLNYHSKIVCFKNNSSYQNSKKYFDLIFLKEHHNSRKNKIEIIKYLFKNSKNINVLYIYHFFNSFYDTINYALIYKLMNPHGKLLIRFEADFNDIDKKYPYIIYNKSFKGKVKYFLYSSLLFRLYFKSIDAFGVIDVKKINKFIYLNKLVKNKCVEQPNGFNKKYILNAVKKINSIEQRENIIILTGRLDDPVKGIDIFLDSIKDIKITDWKIYLVGSDSKILKNKINTFAKNNPSYLNKIYNVGYIENKNDFYKLYNTTKIFILPSLHDGMPLAAVEAMALGNAIISADHNGMKYALEKGEIGELFKIGDSQDLKEKIMRLMNNEDLLRTYMCRTLEKAYNDFEWEKIINNIVLKFNK